MTCPIQSKLFVRYQSSWIINQSNCSRVQDQRKVSGWISNHFHLSVIWLIMVISSTENTGKLGQPTLWLMGNHYQNAMLVLNSHLVKLLKSLGLNSLSSTNGEEEDLETEEPTIENFNSKVLMMVSHTTIFTPSGVWEMDGISSNGTEEE